MSRYLIPFTKPIRYLVRGARILLRCSLPLPCLDVVLSLNRLHGLDFQLGPWLVHPRRNCLEGEGTTVHLEPKVMQVLLLLAERSGETVTRDELIADVWMGAIVTDEVVTRAISALRKALQDDFRNPRYIETLPKLGYRLMPHVVPVVPGGDGAMIGAPQQPVEPPQIVVSTDVPGAKPLHFQARNEAETVAAIRTRFRWTKWLIPGILLVLVAWYVVDGMPEAGSTTASSSSTFQQTFVTTLPGAEFDPALSPSGNQVAFVWTGPEIKNQYHIYVKQLDTEEIRQLTTHPDGGFGPAWSPDGRHIAFIRYAETGCEIMTISVQGGPEQKLADCDANFMADLVWSPDGKHLYYSDRPTEEKPIGIIRYSLETGKRDLLAVATPDVWCDTDPALSPDGKHVAFIRRRSIMMQDVYMVAAEGGEPRRLTDRELPVEGLIWSSDGRSVLFSGSAEEQHGLYVVSAEGGAPRRIHLGNTGLRNPSLSFETERLVGEHWVHDVNLWQLPLGDDGLAAGEPSLVLGSTMRDWMPHFSPDGSRIAYTSNRSGSHEIWVSAPDGEDAVRLTSMNASFTGAPRWSPDGQHIVFEVQRDENADLYLTDVNGNLPRRLTTHAAADVRPRWSKDGQWIYFGSDRDSTWQVWKMPVQGGSPIQVTPISGLSAVESADRVWLYYTRRDTTGLWRMPLEGGAGELVFEGIDHRSFPRQWELTKRGVYFLVGSPGGLQIALFDLEKQQVQTVTTPKFSSGFAISPDGKSLIYSRVDRQESDIVLQEGFSGRQL